MNTNGVVNTKITPFSTWLIQKTFMNGFLQSSIKQQLANWRRPVAAILQTVVPGKYYTFTHRHQELYIVYSCLKQYHEKLRTLQLPAFLSWRPQKSPWKLSKLWIFKNTHVTYCMYCHYVTNNNYYCYHNIKLYLHYFLPSSLGGGRGWRTGTGVLYQLKAITATAYNSLLQ